MERSLSQQSHYRYVARRETQCVRHRSQNTPYRRNPSQRVRTKLVPINVRTVPDLNSRIVRTWRSTECQRHGCSRPRHGFIATLATPPPELSTPFVTAL